MRVKRKKLLEKIVNILLDIFIFLFGVILLIAIYNNIQVKLLGNDYADFFGYSIFEVKTGSMSGTIEIGDWIVVKKSDDIKPNDIITYVENDNLITHRVIEAYNGTFVTRGDNNPTQDKNPVSKDQIIGEVVNILPCFGIIHKVFFNPFVVLAMIITLYFIAYAFNKDDNKNSKLMKGMNVMFEKILNFFKKKKSNVKDSVSLEQAIDKNESNSVTFEKQETSEDLQENIESVEEQDVLEENVSAEDELDKTMYFRMVSVAEDDLKSIYSKKDIARLEEEEEIVVPAKEPEKEEEENEEEIKLNLELLQKKKKKSRHILEKVLMIKNEELLKIIDVLNRGEKLKSNEATIKESFLKTYIDAKYYNYCGDFNLEYNSRNMNSKIEHALKDYASSLIKTYKGSDNKYINKVDKYLNIFLMILYFEQAYIALDDIQSKRDAYINKILKTGTSLEIANDDLKSVVNEILKVQRLHSGMIRYSLTKVNTTMFELQFNSLPIKYFKAVELQHNIEFSKVYSDYIVDKTYSEGIVAEDKVTILINLLLIQISKDMLNADFKNKYLISMPGSIYNKSNKLDKVFKMLNDEYAKNSIYVVIKYEDMVNSKKAIKELVKNGYHFALDINDTSAIKAKDLGCVNLMEYIFIDKKVAKKSEVLATLPKDLHDKLVYENIENKVGSF